VPIRQTWDEETAATYDAGADAHLAPEVVDPTVDLLERRAEGGPHRSWLIGTGRVGIRLATRGVPVILVGDMATTVAPVQGPSRSSSLSEQPLELLDLR
jgi:hypothetical protein